MPDIFTEVQETDFALKEIYAAIRELKSCEVLVGIPDDNAGRSTKKGPVTNAELLYIHTNGSPVNHIPPREVLEPAIKHDAGRIAAELKRAADAALDGNQGGIMPALERAGAVGQNAAQGWFTNPANGWAPNSPAVAAEKAKKKGTPNPLIDTGSMRKSITYKVKKG